MRHHDDLSDRRTIIGSLLAFLGVGAILAAFVLLGTGLILLIQWLLNPG